MDLLISIIFTQNADCCSIKGLVVIMVILSLLEKLAALAGVSKLKEHTSLTVLELHGLFNWRVFLRASPVFL
jgi:hypothetical protein